MIRVFIADDQELVRAGCVMVVRSQPDMAVVGEAADGVQAVTALATTTADVVLMDIRMPHMDGIEATRRILAAGPSAPKIIALTTFDLDEYAFDALRAGAGGFLLKDAPAPDMLSAIRSVHHGNAVIAPSTTHRLVEHLAVRSPGRGGVDPAISLTGREKEVALAVARGRTNAEIAAELFVSEGTVKSHVARILTKLRLRDRIQVVIWAYEHGLIEPGG